MDKLKPCPFCGSENVKLYGEGLSQDTEEVWCRVCRANEKLKIWNTRHIDPATKAQIEAAVLRRLADSPRFNGPLWQLGEILIEEADAIERGEG